MAFRGVLRNIVAWLSLVIEIVVLPVTSHFHHKYVLPLSTACNRSAAKSRMMIREGYLTLVGMTGAVDRKLTHTVVKAREYVRFVKGARTLQRRKKAQAIASRAVVNNA